MAVKFAKQAPPYSYADLISKALFTEESREESEMYAHERILHRTVLSQEPLLLEIMNPPEDRIFACETALKIWEAAVYDGNYLFYHDSHFFLDFTQNTAFDFVRDDPQFPNP